MFQLSWRNPGLIILGTALVLRIVSVLAVEAYVGQRAESPFVISGDAEGYWMLAQRITSGSAYSVYEPPRQVHRMPGYPAWLAASMRLFGNSVSAVRWQTACLSTVICGLTCALAYACAGRVAGWCAAAWMAFSPTSVIFGSLVLSETLFTALLIAAVLSWSVFLQTQPYRYRWMAATTGLLAAATYVRPAALLMLPALIVVWWLTERRRQLVLPGLVALAGLVLCLLPWAVRNQAVTGHWVFTTLWSGPSLYDGLHPEATGASDMRFFDRDGLMNSMSEYEMNRHYVRAAQEYAWQQPLQAAELALRKQWRFWNPMPQAAQFSHWPIKLAGLLFYIPFYLFAAAGLVRGTVPPRSRWLLLTPILVTAGLHLVFVGSIRYRVPIEPLLAVFAGAAVGPLIAGRLSRPLNSKLESETA